MCLMAILKYVLTTDVYPTMVHKFYTYHWEIAQLGTHTKVQNKTEYTTTQEPIRKAVTCTDN